MLCSERISLVIPSMDFFVFPGDTGIFQDDNIIIHLPQIEKLWFREHERSSAHETLATTESRIVIL